MVPRVALKDPYLESRTFTMRAVIVVLVVLALLGILLSRYFSLQITDYDIYRTESDRNRLQLQPLPPKRGLIYDRNGVLLADNRPSYVLSLVVEDVDDLPWTLEQLQQLLEIRDGDLEKFHQRRKRADPMRLCRCAFACRRKSARCWRSIVTACPAW